MRKTLLTMIVGVLFLAVAASFNVARADNFTVTAFVPYASGVVYTITEIMADGEWTDNHPADLNFGTLWYDTEDDANIFRPTKYFAVDLSVTSGGAGQPDNIQFAYDDLVNPNEDAGNGRGGLGMKGTIDVVKAVYEDEDVVVKPKVLLSQVATLGTLDKSLFNGGWPRVYVGMYDGSNATWNAAGWEVFTAADAPDSYVGVLTISATVD